MAITSWMTTMAGAFSRDCGYATNDSTLLAPYFTDTHSWRRGDLSTAWRAQSWAPREDTPQPAAAMPMALPSRNRLLETVCISDALLFRYFRTDGAAGARQIAVSGPQNL